MDEVTPRFFGAMLLSVIIGFALNILPMRDEWLVFRPEWLLLTIIHWGLVAPNKSSLTLVWFLGLMIDAVYGSIIGQHAFGFLIVLLLTLRLRSRLLLSSFFQQVFLICVVLGVYLLLNLWILGATGNSPDGWGYWAPILTSLIVWPFYHFYLHLFHTRNKSLDYQ